MKSVVYEVANEDELKAFFEAASKGESITLALRRDEIPKLEEPCFCVVTADSWRINDSHCASVAEDGIYAIGIAIIRTEWRKFSVQAVHSFDPCVVLSTPVNLTKFLNEGLFEPRFAWIYRRRFRRGHLISDQAASDILSILNELGERDASTIEMLVRSLNARAEFSPTEIEILTQERDAVLVAVDIFGYENLSRSEFQLFGSDGSSEPYLARLNRIHQMEDQIVSADASRFRDWFDDGQNVHVGIKIFSKGSRTLTVINANKTPLEKTTGADLIYYNTHVNAFVLVQYKMLKRPSANGVWLYHPDHQFAKELTLLKEVENLNQRTRYIPSNHLTYRLGQSVTYFKFCRKDAAFEADSINLVSGQYVPTNYVESLMNALAGKRSVPRISEFEMVARSLGNETFSGLVAAGLVGTRGKASAQLRQVVRKVLESGKAVVLAIES